EPRTLENHPVAGLAGRRDAGGGYRSGGFILSLFQLHPKVARTRNVPKLAAVKFLAITFCFQQMLLEIFLVALDDKFQLFDVVRPAETVEKFGTGELRFVERVLRVAGA